MLFYCHCCFIVLAVLPAVSLAGDISRTILARTYRGGGVLDCRFTYCDPRWMRAFSCDKTHPCPDGSCCSYRGFCGTTDEYCIHGCQSNCRATTPSSITVGTSNIPSYILQADLPHFPTKSDEFDDEEMTTTRKSKLPFPDFSLRFDDKDCGIDNFPSSSLVPWQVRLRILLSQGRVMQCSGALLNTRTILTSAKCVRGAEKILAYIGDYDTNRQDANELVVSCQVSVHPKSGTNADYDLAILTPCPNQRDIEYTDKIKPICLPALFLRQRNEKHLIERRYKNVTLSGWGKLGPHGMPSWSFHLERIGSRIFWPDMCVQVWKQYNVTVENTTLCTMNDQCRGDIGSPLFGYSNNRRAVLIGITSLFNADCGKPHALAVYADVISLLSWIRREAKGSLHYVSL